MTYAEVLEYIDDNYDWTEYDDLGMMYEQISNEWFGRSNFEDIISPEEFFNYYESR